MEEELPRRRGFFKVLFLKRCSPFFFLDTADPLSSSKIELHTPAETTPDTREDQPSYCLFIILILLSRASHGSLIEFPASTFDLLHQIIIKRQLVLMRTNRIRCVCLRSLRHQHYSLVQKTHRHGYFCKCQMSSSIVELDQSSRVH
jgi:hypothetical protein